MTTYCLRTNWRWVVTLASGVHLLICMGTLYNYSILFLSFQREFGSGTAATGWVGSMANALSCLLTPVSTLVLRHLSCRTGSALGVLLFAAGLAVTSFATELWHTFLSFGILAAAGSNLAVVADFTHTARWFDDASFPRASALVCVGSSAGMMSMSSLLTVLNEAYGWRSSLRVMSAGILLVGLLAAWTLREPGPGECRGAAARDDAEEGTAAAAAGPVKEALLDSPAVPRQAETRLTTGDDRLDSGGTTKTAVETRLVTGEEEKKDPGLATSQPGRRSVWFTLLRLPRAWLFGTAVILCNNAYTFAVINLGSFMDDLLFSAQDIRLCITMFAVAELVGKLVLAAVADAVPFPLHFVSMTGCLVAALMSAMMAVANRLALLAIYCFMLGLSRASLYAFGYACSNQLFGEYGMTAVNVFGMVPYGIGMLIAAPIAGGLYDVTGNYTLSLLVILGCFVTSAGCFLMTTLWERLRPACLSRRVAKESKLRDAI